MPKATRAIVWVARYRIHSNRIRGDFPLKNAQLKAGTLFMARSNDDLLVHDGIAEPTTFLIDPFPIAIGRKLYEWNPKSESNKQALSFASQMVGPYTIEQTENGIWMVEGAMRSSLTTMINATCVGSTIEMHEEWLNEQADRLRSTIDGTECFTYIGGLAEIAPRLTLDEFT